ncbi:MAG: DUF2490 domain-containing protein [Methylomonas lenta]|nr:DUF2490 domain-containing protein [Methylomonas lenta]
MRNKFLVTLKYLPVIGALYAPFSMAETSNMSGTWNSVTLSGSFAKLSDNLKDFRWQILEQARTRGDSSDGQRLSENLLFGQVGYAINQNASVWVGYMHDWIHPLDKQAFQEDRPYQDFLWNSNFDDFRFTSRTRFEARIRQDTGNVGGRFRQLFQVSYPLEFINKDLRVYAGDEVMGYVNTNTFGPTGFSENRSFGGLSYQFTKELGADLGYMGQFVDNLSGNNVYTHNAQFNLSYKF